MLFRNVIQHNVVCIFLFLRFVLNNCLLLQNDAFAVRMENGQRVRACGCRQNGSSNRIEATRKNTACVHGSLRMCMCGW